MPRDRSGPSSHVGTPVPGTPGRAGRRWRARHRDRETPTWLPLRHSAARDTAPADRRRRADARRDHPGHRCVSAPRVPA